MEPIFARLGVYHQSRNFGHGGGIGTIQDSIGAGSLYGPDISMLIWDAELVDEKERDIDLLARQAIMGGMKIPVFWHLPWNLARRLHNSIHLDVGSMGTAMSGIPLSRTKRHVDNTVWAAKYLKCDHNSTIFNRICVPNEYNATCWIWRRDFLPLGMQLRKPDRDNDWHQGNRYHQLKGRNLAFTLLSALREVLYSWSQSEDLFLDDDMWHVTKYYHSIRSNLHFLDPVSSGCGYLEENHLAFLCKYPFQVSNLKFQFLG